MSCLYLPLESSIDKFNIAEDFLPYHLPLPLSTFPVFQNLSGSATTSNGPFSAPLTGPGSPQTTSHPISLLCEEAGFERSDCVQVSFSITDLACFNEEGPFQKIPINSEKNFLVGEILTLSCCAPLLMMAGHVW